MKKKLGFIFGTRPEIIKLSPIIKLCQKRNIPFFCIHTGQHYSYKMDEAFFKELNLPTAKYKLHIRSKAPYKQGDHTGRMLIKIEEVLLKEMPYSVVVQGDTNSALAGALCAEKISTTESYTGFHIKVAHVEAGLRSFDRMMPEETNRFIIDHLSDYLFIPSRDEINNLTKEGVPRKWIHATGNTIVDSVKEHVGIARRKSSILEKMGLIKGYYILLTMHRQENVDAKSTFKGILRGIQDVGNKFRLPIIFPMHPRTGNMLKRFNLRLPSQVEVIEPLGFLDFLWLEANAALAMTDSGGVQEETCILKVPCITLRENTERPETVDCGSNIIAGIKPEGIIKSASKMIRSKRSWKIPIGDGRTSERILKILMR
ncbi:non-hydrolyzing UDP-N-acetylglucosamine 2-epimerase [Candidatus Omnitrophota bacterium]